MKKDRALKIIYDFKNSQTYGGTHQMFLEMEKNLIDKSPIDIQISEATNLYDAALHVKQLSSRIDEIVHAAGIIKALPLIMENNEKIESLSLASGAAGDGFDLVTNLRVAEFKFSRWQEKSSNGMRKRQVFADFINLLLFPTEKKKELYVYSAKLITKFLQSKKAKYSSVLSRNVLLAIRFSEFLFQNKLKAETLNDIWNLSTITIHDLDQLYMDKVL